MANRKRVVFSGLWVLLVAVLLLPVSVPAQGQQPQYEVFLEVTNDHCRQLQIAQFFFLRDGRPFHTQLAIPPASVSIGQSREFTFELSQRPTEVQLRGTRNGQTLNVTARVGTTRFDCGIIVLQVGDEVPTERPPVDELPELPAELRGIQPGMSPNQVVSHLRNRGFDVEVQGSEHRPKLGDVDDPLIIGALGPGLTVTGYWVSTTAGSLRAAVVHDRPMSTIFLIVVTNAFDLGIAWPPPGGGLGVFLDRPMALAPGTNFGDAPLSGTAALVLVIKLGGPAQPYVLSLSN